jgi:ribosomal protein L9
MAKSKFVGDKHEGEMLTEQFREQLGNKKLAKGASLGSLVRQKMRELSEDRSGEYVDAVGSHFKMSAEGDGYTISYGGGKKAVNVTREQGCKLAGSCRKLESERKELAKSSADILKIANQVESSGAGFFQRAGKDMRIYFRGSNAIENARRVANAIGEQSGRPTADPMSGNTVITVRDAYESKLSAGERKELADSRKDVMMREFLKNELRQYGLTLSEQKHIYDQMADGVEIMSKAQVTKTIEEHIDLLGI